MSDEVVYPIRIKNKLKEQLFICRDIEQERIGYKIGIGQYITKILINHVNINYKSEEKDS